MAQGSKDEENYISIYVIAYRVQGNEGWILEETDKALEEARLAKLEAGCPLAEMQVIERGLRRIKLGEPYQPDDDYAWIHQDGWAYDEVAQCWRGPGEPLDPLPGSPVRVGELKVAFHLPEWGWLPIEITAGEQSVTIPASNAFDPLGELVEWLEYLAQDAHPRMLIDVEGSGFELLAFPSGGNRHVRFTVATSGYNAKKRGREIELDVIVDRRLMVSAMYTSLMAFWESEAFRSNLRHWLVDYDPDENPAKQQPPSLRSNLVEQFLAD